MKAADPFPRIGRFQHKEQKKSGARHLSGAVSFGAKTPGKDFERSGGQNYNSLVRSYLPLPPLVTTPPLERLEWGFLGLLHFGGVLIELR